MRFRVVQTHQGGIALDRADLMRSDGAVGEVVTSQETTERRKIIQAVARLLNPDVEPARDLILPLYQPAVQIIAPTGILLTGVEKIRERRHVVELAQGWWLRLPE